MPGSSPLVQVAPLFVDVANPIVQAPPSKIRPTWNAATIVEPFEKGSGSTSVRWFVAVDPWQVDWVKGSLLIGSAGAAAAGRAATPQTSDDTATAMRATLRGRFHGIRDMDPPDGKPNRTTVTSRSRLYAERVAHVSTSRETDGARNRADPSDLSALSSTEP